ncbi:RUN and FYVE domain-containing protein 2-like isoform X2 [Mya arenaria]|uniref:RUN and FYVE domain-containing protein 2-like isoform X2 n=1 Tax=Mya arenaria TaxID=6604 RepID=UPI0022E2FA0C|nr:RUN and FYVE domain-containing protein 2-like isoform X2 [Mya arenaria]
MATADYQGLDLTDNFGSKFQEDRKDISSRLGKRTEEEIREEHRTLRVLRKLEGHQSQIIQVLSSIERVVCRTTSNEGQEIDNHPLDQSDKSVDASSLNVETTQEKKQIAELSQQLDETKKTITNFNKTVEDNEKQIDVLKGEVRQLSEEKDQLSGDSETNKARLEELQKKVTDKNEKIKKIEEEKSTLIKSIEENNGAVTALTIQLEYKTNLAQLEWQLHQMSDTVERYSALQERCSCLEREIDTKSAEVDYLNREKDDVYAEMNAQRHLQEDHSVELKQKIDENAILRRQLSEKETRLILLVEEKTGAKYEIERLEKEMKKERDQYAETLELATKGKESSTDIAKKHKELDDAKREIEKFKIEKEEEKAKKKVELDEASSEMALVLEQLATADSALLEGAEASKKKQEELDLAKKEIEQLRKAVKREEDEKEKKTVELDEASFEIATLQDRLARLEYALSAGALPPQRSYDTPVKINIKAKGERTCDVQGMVCTGQGIFVLTDWDNKTLKAVDIIGKSVLSVLQLDASPFDITQLKANLLAVTLPEARQIVLVQLLSNGNLNVFETISVTEKCFGIAVLDPGHIIVVNSNVEVYDLQGNRSDILVDMRDESMKDEFEELQYVAFGNNLLYLTDWEQNSVTCMSMDKGIKHQFQFTEEILHDHGAPLGLAVSSTGAVFVRCRKGVYQLDGDLQNGRSLARRLPRGVCLAYSDWDQKVLVAYTNSNIVIEMAVNHS